MIHRKLPGFLAAALLIVAPSVAAQTPIVDPSQFPLEVTSVTRVKDEPPGTWEILDTEKIPLADLSIDVIDRWVGLTEDQLEICRASYGQLNREFLQDWIRTSEQAGDAYARWQALGDEQAKRQELEIARSFFDRAGRYEARFFEDLRLVLENSQTERLNDFIRKRTRSIELEARSVSQYDGVDLSWLLIELPLDRPSTPEIQAFIQQYDTALDGLVSQRQARLERLDRLVLGLEPEDADLEDDPYELSLQITDAAATALKDALPAFHNATLRIDRHNREALATLKPLLTNEDWKLLQRHLFWVTGDDTPDETLRPYTRFVRYMRDLQEFDAHRRQLSTLGNMSRLSQNAGTSSEHWLNHRFAHRVPGLTEAQREAIEVVFQDYASMSDELLARFPAAKAQTSRSFRGLSQYELSLPCGTLEYEHDAPIRTDDELSRDKEIDEERDAYAKAIEPLEQALIERVREILSLEQRLVLIEK